jgi:hypothetical protein
VDHSYITRLPTFAQRGKAIAERLDDIKKNPRYAALSDDMKAKVRAGLYKQLVPASYAGFHLPVPDEKTWVEASAREFPSNQYRDVFGARKLSQTYNDTTAQKAGEDFYTGMDKSFSNMTMFGAHIANAAFAGMYNLAQHYTPGPLKQSVLGQSAKQAAHIAMKTTQNIADAAHNRVQSDDYWLQTHPRETKIGQLTSTAGEMVATLPLYEALGAEGAGGKVLESMKAAPVTSRLFSTPVGKFVAQRLVSAAGAYGAALASSGGNQREAGGVAAADVALGAVFAAPKAIKVASSALAKKWTASVVAEGGIPFAQDIATSAAHEMQPLEWRLKNGTETGVEKYGAGATQVGRDLAIIPHGEDEGHFVNTKTNEAFYYKGKQEQQLVFNQLTQEHLQVREQEDPVMAKLHEAEKTTLNSLALRSTGTFFEHLSDDQKLDVLSQRWDQIHQAAAEAPVHLPEQLHEQIDAGIKAERAANPQLDSLMKQDEQMFGAKFADEYTENAVEAVAHDTGISNQRGAARAIMSAERGLAKGDNITPAKFASLNGDTRAYFRAPQNRTGIDFITQRSKEAYDKTYQFLKKADGGFFKAENPLHRFLYHYADKAKLPPGIRQSVLHWIKQSPGFENSSEKEIYEAAKQMRVHMYDMAKSGHLKMEGNIFASTKTGGPVSWSPWQAPLSNESDAEVIKQAQKALTRHPDALRGFNTTVKAIQKQMLKAKTPEELQAYKDALEEASRKIVTSTQRGTVKIGE